MRLICTTLINLSGNPSKKNDVISCTRSVIRCQNIVKGNQTWHDSSDKWREIRMWAQQNMDYARDFYNILKWGLGSPDLSDQEWILLYLFKYLLIKWIDHEPRRRSCRWVRARAGSRASAVMGFHDVIPFSKCRFFSRTTFELPQWCPFEHIGSFWKSSRTLRDLPMLVKQPHILHRKALPKLK